MSFNTARNAATTNVAASATAVTLFAANNGAQGRSIKNDLASAALDVKFGSAASPTDRIVRLAPGDYYEFPQPVYVGVVTGTWVSATGYCNTTEVY